MENALVIFHWLTSNLPVKINGFIPLHLCQWDKIDRQSVSASSRAGHLPKTRLLHIPRPFCWGQLGTWCPGTWPTHWLMLIHFHWPPIRHAVVPSHAEAVGSKNGISTDNLHVSKSQEDWYWRHTKPCYICSRLHPAPYSTCCSCGAVCYANYLKWLFCSLRVFM